MKKEMQKLEAGAGDREENDAVYNSQTHFLKIWESIFGSRIEEGYFERTWNFWGKFSVGKVGARGRVGIWFINFLHVSVERVDTPEIR